MAEKKEIEVKVGDVWQSRGSALKVKVLKVDQDSWGVPMVQWERINHREQRCCSVYNFPRNRVLVERDGQKVTQ